MRQAIVRPFKLLQIACQKVWPIYLWLVLISGLKVASKSIPYTLAPEPLVSASGMGAISFIYQHLINLLLTGILIVLTHQWHKHQTVSVISAIMLSWRRFWPLLITNIVSSLSRLIWLLPTIIPLTLSNLKGHPSMQYDPMVMIVGFQLLSIAIGMWFFAVPYAVLLERKSIVQSLRFSIRIVCNHWFLVLVALLSYQIIFSLPSLIAWQGGEISPSIKLLVQAIGILIAPIQVYVYLLLFNAINPPSTSTEQAM